MTVASLEGRVSSGVADLLREALLVHKAACDVNASVSELVGWCLDTCSAPAAALAALWGRQQSGSLTPRLRSFYSLMLQRLGLLAERRAAEGWLHGQARPDWAAEPPAPGCSPSRGSGGGDGPSREAFAALALAGSGGPRGAGARVLSGSVIRTASRATSAEEVPPEGPGGGGDGGAAPEAAAGPGGPAAEPEGGGGGAGPAKHKPINGSANGSSNGGANGSVNGSVNGRGGGGYRKGSSSGKGGEPRLEGGGGGRGGGGGGGGGAADLEDVLAAEALKLEYDLADAGLVNAASAAAGLAAPPPAAAVTISPRPSLLQRPARGAPPPPGSADPSEEGAAAIEAGGGGDGLLGSDLARVEALQAQPYIPMRLVSVGRYPLRDLSGAVLEGGLPLPQVGPIVLSTDPRVFPGTEAVLSDPSGPARDKLAARLEYITDRSSYGEVTLQLFNMSRVTRKRTDNCRFYVNDRPVSVGEQGVVLVPGDRVVFGGSGWDGGWGGGAARGRGGRAGREPFAFRVEALPEAPSPVEEALRRLGRAAEAAGAPEAAGEEGAYGEAGGGGRAPAGGGAGWSMSSTEEVGDGEAGGGGGGGGAAAMAELAVLSRRDPRSAELRLRQLATADPGDAAVWLLWAQLYARQPAPPAQARARFLFRCAASAASRMKVIPPPPLALQEAARRTMGAAGNQRGRYGSGRRRRRGAASSSMDDDEAASPYDGLDAYGNPLPPPPPGAPPPPRRHNWLLVQSLGNWAKHEWRLRMYGSARHLFRAAVDEAAKHPDGVGGGGGAALLHYWAVQELDCLNVRNARIVAAEALRKCPADVALYTLAAGVEMEGGNLEQAKAFCQRAYKLDVTDKQLLALWPRVEAALGDRVKARLLYDRALDIHPLNTKILNSYARFRAEEGMYGDAAALYDRALRIDSLSPGPGVRNRCDWAALESDLGNTGLARGLLEDGLAIHPHSPYLLVGLAKVERLEGRYDIALQLTRRAQAVAGAFNPAVMTEKAAVLRALGEREMAANLTRHATATRVMQSMKRQGYWGSEAWRAFVEATRGDGQQDVVAAARERRLELGWVPRQRGGKPQPTGVAAGEGRRHTSADAQQWVQLQALSQQRMETRRLTAARAARLRAEALAAGGETEEYDEDEEEEEAEEEEEEASMAAMMRRRRLGGGGTGAGGGGMAAAGSGSFDDEEYGEEGAAVSYGVPTLDAVRRLTPSGED